MRVDPSRIDATLVDPGVFADVTALLEGIQTSDPDAYAVFTTGWRDQATEAAGYAAWLADHSNPKYTDPADSAHVGANFPDGKSRAIDFTLVMHGKDDWTYTDSVWRAIVAAAAAHPRLHSLDAIGDTDHLQKVRWQADKTPQ